MKRALIFLALAVPCAAMEPKYSYKDPKLDDEIREIYHQMGSLLKGIVRFKGTTTNDNALTGNVGEYVESVVEGANAGASTQFGDATSIILTAGDWDVTLIGEITINGGTP